MPSQQQKVEGCGAAVDAVCDAAVRALRVRSSNPHLRRCLVSPEMASSTTARDFVALDPPLLSSTLAVLARLGFKRMTPVQAATLPLFLGNKDVAVEVRVGSRARKPP